MSFINPPSRMWHVFWPCMLFLGAKYTAFGQDIRIDIKAYCSSDFAFLFQSNDMAAIDIDINMQFSAPNKIHPNRQLVV